MNHLVQSIEAYVSGVRCTPADREQKQREVIREFRRACPSMETDEVFSVLASLNPALFRDEADEVQADQVAVNKPRLVKLPGATDEENDAEAERICQQAALIGFWKKRNPKATTDQIFSDLMQRHPDLFSDPDLTPPNSDI